MGSGSKLQKSRGPQASSRSTTTSTGTHSTKPSPIQQVLQEWRHQQSNPGTQTKTPPPSTKLQRPTTRGTTTDVSLIHHLNIYEQCFIITAHDRATLSTHDLVSRCEEWRFKNQSSAHHLEKMINEDWYDMKSHTGLAENKVPGELSEMLFWRVVGLANGGRWVEWRGVEDERFMAEWRKIGGVVTDEKVFRLVERWEDEGLIEFGYFY